MTRQYLLLLLVCLVWANCVGAQPSQQHRFPTQQHQARARQKSAVSIASIAAPSPASIVTRLSASPMPAMSAAKPSASSSASPSVATVKPTTVWGSSSSSKCSGSWQLSAINATYTKLPNTTQRVLICIISSGILHNINHLKHNSWSGCSKEDPLDPGGCVLNWQKPALDSKGKPKLRGTYAAVVMAARAGLDPNIIGVIPGRADIYVVPVDTETGATDPGSQASGGSSRLHAYSNCEGRLRGLQAQDVGSETPTVRWRMVIYVDVKDPKPAIALGTGTYQIDEADWLATASGKTDDGHQPDVLVVAPASELSGRLTYPAADTHVLAVGGYNCDGQPLIRYSNTSSRKPDILAPGYILVPDINKDWETGRDRPWNGSAPAAALTAAVAARLWSAYPYCGADVIRQAITSSRPGAGLPAMLNLQAAVVYLDNKVHKCSGS